MNSPIPELLLERYPLRELDPAQNEAIRARLDADPALKTRLQELEASNREILARLPASSVAAEVRLRAGRAATPARPAAWHLAWAVPAITAAAVTLAVFTKDSARHAGMSGVTNPDGERIKGLAPRLAALRIRGGVAEPVASGAEAKAGDTVQLSYVSAGRDWGVVLSIDGRGAVTLHLPSDASKAALLAKGGAVALPTAYVLDDAPGFERFIFISSGLPFSPAQVIEAAHAVASRPDVRVARLDLPDSLEQSNFLLIKVVP